MTYEVGYKKPPLATRWQPGIAPLGAGRPKNSLTKLLQDFLDENDEERKKGIIRELHTLALSRGGRGQIPALIEIYNRVDGKVADKHEIRSLVVHIDKEYAGQLLREALHEIDTIHLEALDATE